MTAASPTEAVSTRTRRIAGRSESFRGVLTSRNVVKAAAITASCKTPLLIDRCEFLDPQTGTDAIDQLLGVVDDPDRVFVIGRALLHIGFTFGLGGKIVDQKLDLIVIRVMIIHRRRDPVVDTAKRADAALFQPLIIVDQVVEAAKSERDMMQSGF